MRISFTGMSMAALLLMCPAPGHAQTPAPETAITGRVVDADTQAPIAGARVMLVRAFSARPTGPMGPPPQATTGDDGAYMLSGIPPGSYRVQVQKTGFIFDPANMAAFQVAEGQTEAVADSLVRRGAVIAGRVLDAHGEGIADVMVRAVRPPRVSGRGQPGPIGPPGQSGQTNDIGEFRLAGLAPGDYYVAAMPRTRSPLEQSASSGGTAPATTFYPGSAEMSGARIVTVVAGQTVGGVEFSMLSARGFAISGVVVDETGRPVGNAMVSITQAAPAMLGSHALSRTRPDGTFTVANLLPGTYRLTASVLVTVSTGGGGFSTSTSSSGPGSTPLSVTVNDSDVVGVRVVAPQPR